VIVAVFPVRMVQVPTHQIIGVIPVQHSFVATIGSMNVVGVMRPALVVRRAAILIGWPVGQFVFVDMISMHVVQMTFVKIIDVAIVPDRGVPTIRAVRVCVSFLFQAGLRHFFPFLAVASRKNNRYGRTRASGPEPRLNLAC
jgi:hypothetical protein